jgi:spermidine/putrescine transport system permease protein
MPRNPTRTALGYLLRLHVLAILLFLFAPILVIVAFSFDGSLIPIYPLNDPTLKWYGQLFGQYSEEYMQPLYNSLYVALLTSVIATTLGGLAGFAMSRYEFPGDSVFPFLVATPAMVPPLISGFGVLVLLRQTLGVELSLLTVVVGHVALTMPFAAFIISGKLGPEAELERAARDLGAGYVQLFTQVTLPLIGPAVAASVLLTFTISLGESAMVFLISGSQPLLPIQLQSRLASTITPRFNAISTILIVITFGLFLLAELIRQNVNT